MNPKAKNWIIGIISFVAGVIIIVIGFFVLTIYVSFIREKEDADTEEEEPFVTMVDDETMRMHASFQLPMIASGRCEEIPMSSIPVGSWWTDGDIYYKVLSNDADTLYMMGTSLSDPPGIELTFVKEDFYMKTYGSSAFAMYDSRALAYQLKLADGSFTQFIVSYYDEDWLSPQSILQRYSGKGLGKYNGLFD